MHASATALPWAKTSDKGGPVYPLWRHSLDTAAAATAIWDGWLRFGLREQLSRAIGGGNARKARSIVAAVAGLHDLGKANPAFQHRYASATDSHMVSCLAALNRVGLVRGTSENIRHAAVSEMTVRSTNAAGDFCPDELSATGYVADGWAATVLGGHHGTYSGAKQRERDEGAYEQNLEKESSVWTTVRTQLMDSILSLANASYSDLKAAPNGDEAVTVILVSGIVMVADWLASSSMPNVIQPAMDKRYMAEAITYYREKLSDTLGLPADIQNPSLSLFDADKPVLKPLQLAGAKVSERGLWVVRETTGSGKTEAAFLRHFAAGQPENIIFTLPTRATTDTMWKRVQAFYKEGAVGALKHEYSMLNARAAGGSISPSAWSTEVMRSIKTLLLPVVVGTVDQVLSASLPRAHSPVRLLALANAHVVLDEVHLMDSYQRGLLEPLMAWWGKTDTRVTLLSASLPQDYLEKFIRMYSGASLTAAPYPNHLLAASDGSFPHNEALTSARAYRLDVTRVNVKATDADWSRSRAEILARAAADQANLILSRAPKARVAVILNTVDAAIAASSILRTYGRPVTTLHSRMTAGHRSDVTERLLSDIAGKSTTTAGDGTVTVGTQVLEASLDVDFDYLISELAPADALVQRAGRTWRFSDPQATGWVHTRPRLGDPSLTLLVPESADFPGRIPDSLEAPYPRAALQRTLDSLPPTGSLRVPEDIQAFVDAAADYSSPKTQNTASGLREIGTIHRRIERAADAVSSLGKALKARRLQYGHLAELTARPDISVDTLGDEEWEAGTRYTEYTTVPAILVGPGPTDRVYAKPADIPSSTDDMAELLSRVVPVPEDCIPRDGGKARGKFAGRLHKLREFKDDAVFGKTPLSRLVVVEIRAGAEYDPELGLRTTE